MLFKIISVKSINLILFPGRGRPGFIDYSKPLTRILHHLKYNYGIDIQCDGHIIFNLNIYNTHLSN